MSIQIIKAEEKHRHKIADIFAQGFTQWLTYFSNDSEVISKAFAHMFKLDLFYVAIKDDTVIAMCACTDCKHLSVGLDKKELKKYLGFLKGSIAYYALKREFEVLMDNPPLNTGSIEYVGTDQNYRGQGVATLLIESIMKRESYQDYLIDEVASNNTAAIKLYLKLGFEEYKRKIMNEKEQKISGIEALVSFRYSK